MDQIERELADIVVRVTDVRDEARALLRMAEEIYQSVIDIAIRTRDGGVIELTMPPVSANEEELG